MPQRHTADTPQITFSQRETTIEIVRVQTANLFEQLGRPPTLREIAAVAGRAPSIVSGALTELERRGHVRMRSAGRVRRLASCAGVPTEAERIVRRLARAGMLKVDPAKALSVVGDG